MPGYGYRILKPQAGTPLQRVINLIGDLQDRMRGLEATRPGFSVSDTDPTVPGADGMMHLNKAMNRLWVYTAQGWITADSYQRYEVDNPDIAFNNTAYADQVPSVNVLVPAGGAFVNVYAGMNVRAAVGTGAVEVALNDGVDLLDTRVVSGSVGTTASYVDTEPGNSAGGVLGTGGWLTFWAATAGTRTLRLRVRAPGGASMVSSNRVIMAVVF